MLHRAGEASPRRVMRPGRGGAQFKESGMNVQTLTKTLAKGDRAPEAAARQARVDLAAAHRLAVLHGFHEGIFNHFTLAVPGKGDRYFQIPFGLHWSEVTASCLMEVSYATGEALSGEGLVERSAYCIHGPMHQALPERAAAVFHTHMPFASALARLEDPRIQPIGQTELGLMRKTCYDFEYAGPAFVTDEGARLAGLMAEPETGIMIMANHGALTIGANVAEAYDRLYYLERVAQVQLYAMWTGRPLKVLSEEQIELSYREFQKMPAYGEKSAAQHHFDALKRTLDRSQPDYAD
jgi:ribulose-5-phosphate 4-epimerase/fuculose-1-phosphate aldolase